MHSQEESQGIVFAEAMAVGLPVVSTKVGGIPYVVSHGETGLLAEYEDVEAFAINMSMLLQNNALYDLMSKNGKIDSKNYLWDSIAKRIIDVYSTLI